MDSKHTTEPVAWPPLEKDVRARIVNLYNNPRAWTPERLNALLDAVSVLATSASSTATAEDVRDAQRYRWLRDQHTYREEFADQGMFRWFVMAGREPVPCDPGALDAEVDAAMLSTPKD